MEKTASGGSISLTVSHAYNDMALDLVSLRYTVYDAIGNVVVPTTEVTPFDPTSGQTTITIDGAANTIFTKYDVRSVKFEMFTDTAKYLVNEFYEIEGDILLLTPFVDSFMTFAESMLIRRHISTPTHYYDALADEDKAVALENAYGRLAGLRFGCLPGNVRTLAELDPQQAYLLDPKFLEALKKAQIVEANHLVEVNPVRDKIRMGIISETIGESSMFFKQNGADVRSIYPGVSDDAYPLLSKYLFRETSNAQIWKLRRS